MSGRHLGLTLQVSSIVKENVSVVLSYQVCGTFLRLPLEINTDGKENVAGKAGRTRALQARGTNSTERGVSWSGEKREEGALLHLGRSEEKLEIPLNVNLGPINFIS